MSKPFIFVSCGQFTEAEKSLGKEIVKMVEATTTLRAFFAEEVHDLNGLNDNILNALRQCAGFIAAMHPRGQINRPNGASHIRASVWIEQEIAIAAYAQIVEKRSIPVIVFKHKSVGREGIRELLNVNPIAFVQESEVLAALPDLLAPWKTLTSTGIRILLTSQRVGVQDAHPIRRLNVNLVNDGNERITHFDGLLRVPSGLLGHWSAGYVNEEQSEDPSTRQFRLSEKNRGPIMPRSNALLMTLDYCLKCASEAVGGIDVPEATVQATVWINNREFSDVKELNALRENG